ncbi:MAG TPA: UvrB/UvrC motif-containing protein, partial [Acidimicrobiales bacterium]|nr:UvrB/UvrC motif-containing protein [Acidimicrobiales bacterium]
ETHRRRAVQQVYNEEHGIDPQTIRKAVSDILVLLGDRGGAGGAGGSAGPGGFGPGGGDSGSGFGGPSSSAGRRRRRRDRARSDLAQLPPDELARLISTLEDEMREAAADLRFEYAARLRDEIADLKSELADIAIARG